MLTNIQTLIPGAIANLDKSVKKFLAIWRALVFHAAMQKEIDILVDRLGGEDAFTAGLGVSRDNFRKARKRGLMPARWYKPLKEFGAAQGILVSDDLFYWLDPKREDAA